MEVIGDRVHVITWGSVGFVIQILPQKSRYLYTRTLTSRCFRPLEPHKPSIWKDVFRIGYMVTTCTFLIYIVSYIFILLFLLSFNNRSAFKFLPKFLIEFPLIGHIQQFIHSLGYLFPLIFWDNRVL